MINGQNAVMGPAFVYWALFPATEPAYTALTSPPSSSVWTDVGAIVDGTSVLLEVQHTITDIHCEQLVDPIGGRVSKRVIQVTAALLEASLQNLNLAMNQMSTNSPGTGYTVFDPLTSPTALQPQYMAILIDGWAPTSGTDEAACRRRMIVRKCLSSSKVDLEYEKTKTSQFNTTWTGYFISSTLPPFEIIDQTT